MCDATFEDLPEEEVTITEPVKAPKWHRLVPYYILVLLFAVGLAVYLCIPYASVPVSDPEMPWFSIQDGTLYYDASLYTGPAELTVPSKIAGQTVTVIGGACFAGDGRITTVKLPDTIQSISASAFADCTALRGVFIPESVGMIGEKAFHGCVALESLCIPFSVKTIGAEAFANCPKLIHIFYTGPHTAWASLYNERISSETRIYTANGTVKQEDIASSVDN